MRRLGQHFLKDKKNLEKIADTIRGEKLKTVIEVGPGHGELTEYLISRQSKAKFYILERDKSLASTLRQKFSKSKKISVIEGNALETLPLLLKSSKEKIGEYAIIGNIPYYITGHLLKIISQLDYLPKVSVFLMQKEVAERISAVPPNMNRLSASVQFWADPKIIATVLPGSFSPPPKVNSAIIMLRSKTKFIASREKYYDIVRAVFSQPRKTILNNLLKIFPKKDVEIIFYELNIRPEDRPQNMSVKIIEALSKKI